MSRVEALNVSGLYLAIADDGGMRPRGPTSATVVNSSRSSEPTWFFTSDDTAFAAPTASSCSSCTAARSRDGSPTAAAIMKVLLVAEGDVIQARFFNRRSRHTPHRAQAVEKVYARRARRYDGGEGKGESTGSVVFDADGAP